MHKRLLTFIFAVTCLFFLGGCASLNGNVPFQYQPSLVAADKKVDVSVGFNLLTDTRPDNDKKYTKSIDDVSEKITAKFLEDFKAANIFRDIHYPARPEDDIVINGTVERFKWKLYVQGWVYIPYVGLLGELLGAEYVKAYGIAGVNLEIKNNKTGVILANLQESAERTTGYTIYNEKAGEAGAELAEALREVEKKLKDDFVTKVNWQ